MEARPHALLHAATEPASGGEVLALVPAPTAALRTREHRARTRLGQPSGILHPTTGGVAGTPRASLATRRYAMRRRRRRKRLLTGLAIVIGLFPPMWVVYFVAWLVWRSRLPQKSMRRVHKAIRALEKDQTGVALKHLQEAHYLDPSNNDALYWLGLLLSRQQRHEEAAEALSLVAERVPDLPEVDAALVDAYVATDAPEQAIYHAQRLYEQAPHDPNTLLKLAEAFEAAGRRQLAIETLQQAPLQKRMLTGGLLAIHYQLGLLYEQQGEREQALHHLKRVYARDITYRDIRARVEALEADADMAP